MIRQIKGWKSILGHSLETVEQTWPSLELEWWCTGSAPIVGNFLSIGLALPLQSFHRSVDFYLLTLEHILLIIIVNACSIALSLIFQQPQLRYCGWRSMDSRRSSEVSLASRSSQRGFRLSNGFSVLVGRLKDSHLKFPFNKLTSARAAIDPSYKFIPSGYIPRVSTSVSQHQSASAG